MNPRAGTEETEGVRRPLSPFQRFCNILYNVLIKISNILLVILVFSITQGCLSLRSLIQWVRICARKSGRKGRMKSKDLITGRFLGQGCSGIFYETAWLRSQQSIVRLVRKDFPGVEGGIFESEVVRLFELKNHPNIVKILGWAVGGRSCSLVMEQMRDDLSSVMRREKEALRRRADLVVGRASLAPFKLLKTMDIALQIAIGMEYLHDQGIIHGDLKPNNVLAEYWDEDSIMVKLADFGLIETKKSTSLISQHALCFRMIEWSAPEVFENYFGSFSEELDYLWRTPPTVWDANLTPSMGSSSSASNFKNFPKLLMTKADSYSFALTCTYMLVGGQVWDAKLSPQELRRKISYYGLRPKLPPECPEKLASLISKCWNANPNFRPSFSVIRIKLQEIIKEQRELEAKLHTRDILQEITKEQQDTYSKLIPCLPMADGGCVKEFDDAGSSHDDGCQEFFPSLTPNSRKCAGCGCHKNYHKPETAAAGARAGPSNVHNKGQQSPSGDSSTTLIHSGSKSIEVDFAITSTEADSEPGAVGCRDDLQHEKAVTDLGSVEGGNTADRPNLESKHKVFLSHSGAQKDFVEQLCIDLERCDRYSFFYKQRSSLPVGVTFPKLLFEAIQQCEVGVVVLSEEFFTRTKWPMLELVEMVRTSKKSEGRMTIVPVFFRITREECRKQETQERWISRWDRWAIKDKTIKIEEWKAALRIFGSSNGLSLTNGEVQLREELVDAICALVMRESLWDDLNVEGKDRLCKVILDEQRERGFVATLDIRKYITDQKKKDSLPFVPQQIPSMKVGVDVPFKTLKESILSNHTKNEPSLLGLHGSGGVGKTLLARMLHNDEDVKRKYGAGSILWITVGLDARVPDLYKNMGLFLEVEFFREI